MTTVRLTNAIRDEIAKKALEKSGIEEELKQHAKEVQQFSFDVRTYLLGGEKAVQEIESQLKKITTHIAAINKHNICEVYLASCHNWSFRVSFGGMQTRLNFGQDEKGDPIYMVTPSTDKALLAGDHELSKRFMELENKGAQLNSKREEIKNNVYAALKSVTSLKRLLEVWPEAKELLPKTEDIVRATLPSVKVEDLNKMIGLPTETQSAA